MIAHYDELYFTAMQGKLKKLHRSPNMRLGLLSGGAHHAAKSIHFPPHQHSHWELVYYRAGTVECFMDGESRAGYPGLVWLTPPGVVHAECAVTAYANYYIALELQPLQKWPAFLDDDADSSIGRLCHQIVLELNRPAHKGRRMRELLAEQLAILLDRVSSEGVLSTSAQSVAQAERFIEEHSRQPLTIQEAARAAHVSPSTLRAYFKKVRGCSPRYHLQQVRLGKAIDFLRTSTLKLETIAELCGYDSASHLTRCVKKATGETPGRVRLMTKQTKTIKDIRLKKHCS